MRTTFSLSLLLSFTACDDKTTSSNNDAADSGVADSAGDSQGDTTSPDVVGPAGSIESSVAAAFCANAERCLDYDTSEDVLLYFIRKGSPGTCESFVKRAFWNGRLDAGLASGAYTLVQANLDACLTALGARCVNDIGLVCQDMLEGKVALGEECLGSEDCAGDAYCYNDGCLRQCRERVGADAECDGSEACSQAAARLTCSYDSFKCVPLVDGNPAALGAPCGDVHAADRVTMTSCAPGLACQDEACQAIAAAGAPCQGDHTACALGTICRRDSPEADTGSCQPLAVANAVGDTCKEDFGAADAIFCNQAMHLGCLSGKCALGGDGSAGSTCFAEHDGPYNCDPGHYCAEATDQCLQQRADGDPCTTYEECVSGYCDDSQENPVCESTCN